ncbi:MAG TPA: ABC transporter substrate-binding protein [Acidimicrobiia bacterium]|jgi:ABC-type branched-subunit amino acid transport system substrate-binding protein
MSKRIALLIVVSLTAACGTQAGKPGKAESGLGGKAPAAAPEAALQAQDQPVNAPEGTATTIAQAVNQAAAAAGAAAPSQARTATSGPTARYGAGSATGTGTGSGGASGTSGSGAASASAPGGAAPAPSASGGSGSPVPGVGGPSAAKGLVLSKGQGFSDTTIKIGATFPLSGAIGFVGQECAGGIDAYVKLVNARGGIHGRRIELISYDDGFDPAQTLSNVKRLWEQDKVAMVFAFVVDSANEYVRSKNIPFFTFGGSPGGFASKYPTIIPVGGSFLTWGQQVAISVTKYMNRHPKVVAVMTDTQILNTHVTAKYIEDYWKKLGAEKVFVEPVDMTQGDCSAQVLKYKQAGVEYWDWQSFAFVFCMPAEERLGWRPPLGQGGPVASMGSLSSTIGRSMEGVVAGAPSDLPDGRPRFTAPTKAHLEMVEAMKRYHPSLAGYQLSSPALGAYYFAAKYIVSGALQGAGDLYGELSPDALLKWIYQSSNYDTGVTTPIRGYKPNCKQGNNTTWWGLWKWDEGQQKLVNNPLGPHVDNSWYTQDPCFMSKVADEVIK